MWRLAAILRSRVSELHLQIDEQKTEKHVALRKHPFGETNRVGAPRNLGQSYMVVLAASAKRFCRVWECHP